VSSILNYPAGIKIDQVDTYHGVEVKDPFRPLEEKSKDRDHWIKAQIDLTAVYLEQTGLKPAIQSVAERLWPYRSLTLPIKRGKRWFATQAGGPLQKTIVSHRLGGPWRDVIDPASWSNNGLVAVNNSFVSPDGKLIMYSFTWAGQDRSQWRICEVDTRATRPDFPWSTGEPAWAADSKGCYYIQYTEIEKTDAEGNKTKWSSPKIWHHPLGTLNENDRLVATDLDGVWAFLGTSFDDYIVMRDSNSGGQRARGKLLAVAAAAKGAKPFTMLGGAEAVYMVVQISGSLCYLLTDLDAPRFRLIAIDLAEGESAKLREIIPEQKLVLNSCAITASGFVADYLDGPISRLKLLDRKGQLKKTIALPADGTIPELQAVPGKHTVLYSFDSTAVPRTTFQLDTRNGKQKELYRASPPDFDPSAYVTERHFATSKDGTQVPIVLVCKKGLVKDGNAPTYMYGYGGFGLSVRPRFDRSIAVWLEMGGVYASVSLRGGGEYGEKWHADGTKLKKQKVFDDFIAAGEWLVENGITRPKRLAIGGVSNGGLLVAACALQRPDLFAAVFSSVGVHDVIRYHLISKNKAWAPDYGISDDEQEFKAQLAYSPVQNVKAGVPYPAFMIACGAKDDRVDPAHSYKLLALLQEASSGGQPILGAIELNSGHGIGTDPVTMQIRRSVEQWTFIAFILGMQVGAREAAQKAEA